MIFGKKKEENEKLLSEDIKNATKPSDLPNPSQQNMENTTTNSFNNPFAQEMPNPFQPKQNLGQVQSLNLNTPPTDIKPMQMPNLEQRNIITEEMVQNMIEETVEKILDDRWEKFLENIDKIIAWKDKQDEELVKIKQDMLSIKDAVEVVERKIFTKISEYDKDILDVSSEIRALEKVFQKITPTFINNIAELGKITQELKDLRDTKK